MKFALAHDEHQSMKRKRLREQQIVGILKEHEAGVRWLISAASTVVSDASVYKWKA